DPKPVLRGVNSTSSRSSSHTVVSMSSSAPALPPNTHQLAGGRSPSRRAAIQQSTARVMTTSHHGGRLSIASSALYRASRKSRMKFQITLKVETSHSLARLIPSPRGSRQPKSSSTVVQSFRLSTRSCPRSREWLRRWFVLERGNRPGIVHCDLGGVGGGWRTLGGPTGGEAGHRRQQGHARDHA